MPATPGPGRQVICVSLGLLTQYLSPAVTAAIVLALALLVMDWSAPPPRATGPIKPGMNWSNMASRGRAGQAEMPVGPATTRSIRPCPGQTEDGVVKLDMNWSNRPRTGQELRT